MSYTNCAEGVRDVSVFRQQRAAVSRSVPTPSARVRRSAGRRLFGDGMPRTKKAIPVPVISMYGRIQFERGYCRECEGMSFIKDGCYTCCGAIADRRPKKFQRVSETTQRRKLPSIEDRDKILTEQEYSCFYCGAAFNSIHTRNGEQLILKLTWDHKLPYVMFKNSDAINFVAACHVCNGIKSDLVFQDVDEAKTYLYIRRKQKGYDF